MEDYERVDAKEWQMDEGGSSTVRPKRNPLLLTLVEAPDQKSTAAWRRNERPADTVRLPRDFNPQGLNVQHGLRRPGVQNALLHKLKQVSAATNTHIEPRSGVYWALELWGDVAQVADARRQLNEWIKECALPQANDKVKTKKWAKTPSYTPEMKAQMEDRLDSEAKRQSFRRAPLPDIVFPVQGMFAWPGGRPEQVLGRSFEALDAIRMDHFCYIAWEGERASFIVSGTDSAEVKTAVLRLRTTYSQVVARENIPAKSYHFSPTSAQAAENTTIKLVPHLTTAKSPNSAPSVRPQLLAGSGSQVLATSSELETSTITKLQRTLSQALKLARLVRGYLRLRVRLGQFLLTSYKRRDSQTLEAFEIMMQDPQARGEVTQEIRSGNIGKTLLDCAVEHDNLFSPADTMTANILDVLPAYTSAFTIRGPDGSILRCKIGYTSYDDGEMIAQAAQWLKEPQNGEEITKVLDTCVVDLINGTAWQFDLTVQDCIDEDKYPSLEHFVKHVELNPAILQQKRRGNNGYLSYKNTPGIQVLSIEQKSTWCLRLGNGLGSAYECELSKTQDMQPNDTGKNLLVSPEPRWTLEVFASRWDIALAANANLSVGRELDSQLSMAHFFEAADGEGADFPAFLQLLDKVAAACR